MAARAARTSLKSHGPETKGQTIRRTTSDELTTSTVAGILEIILPPFPALLFQIPFLPRGALTMKFQATIFVIALVASVSLQPPCAAGGKRAELERRADPCVCQLLGPAAHSGRPPTDGGRGGSAQGDLAKLTWDEAKQYHLIITVAQSPDPTAGNQSVHALEQFVKTGGGLLFFRRTYDDPNSPRPMRT